MTRLKYVFGFLQTAMEGGGKVQTCTAWCFAACRYARFFLSISVIKVPQTRQTPGANGRHFECEMRRGKGRRIVAAGGQKKKRGKTVIVKTDWPKKMTIFTRSFVVFAECQRWRQPRADRRGRRQQRCGATAGAQVRWLRRGPAAVGRRRPVAGPARRGMAAAGRAGRGQDQAFASAVREDAHARQHRVRPAFLRSHILQRYVQSVYHTTVSGSQKDRFFSFSFFFTARARRVSPAPLHQLSGPSA